MANEVFANGRELACKAGDGKSVCAFPDVCFTPPLSPPPGIPIPYPNTAYAKDTKNGSKTVKISNKEVALRNKSYFKTSDGNEAARTPKKGIITGKIEGKAYFKSWSSDVKIEGKNVVRHFDLMTHNHGCEPPNTLPWLYKDQMTKELTEGDCEKEMNEFNRCCKKGQTTGCTNSCKQAQKCILVPKGKDKKLCCKPCNTGHHLIEDHWTKGKERFNNSHGESNSNAFYNSAPTVCVEGSRFKKEHGSMHVYQGLHEESYMHGKPNAGKLWNYGAGKKAALDAHQRTFEKSKCSTACLEAQLDAFYGKDNTLKFNEPSRQKLAVDKTKLAVDKTKKDVHITREEGMKKLLENLGGGINGS